MSFDLAVFRSTLHKALDEWDLDYSKEKLLKMDQFA